MQDRCREHRTGRVVIVEPHDDSRAMYAAYFESVGFKVSAVQTAAGALRVVSREAPDAVVTCLRLRGMDGFALCDAVRALPKAARIPVIGVSSCRLDHERAIWDPRFSAVLMKPCLPDVLLESVRDALASLSESEHAKP